jgi:hypothetical protein
MILARFCSHPIPSLCRNASESPSVTATLGQGPHPNNLARLRVKGFITRVPGRHLYLLTGDGLGIAIFYTKLHDRLLRSPACR